MQRVDLLSTVQAAKILGVTAQMVSHYFRRGLLELAPSDERGHFFRATDVHALADARKRRHHGGKTKNSQYLKRVQAAKGASPLLRSVEPYGTEEAHLVFEALDRKLSLIECSRQCKVHPRRVAMIAEDYAMLNESMVIGADVMRGFAKLPIEGSYPFASDQAFLTAIESALVDVSCSSCKKKQATHCRACARKDANDP